MSNNNLVRCEVCKKKISKSATVCPNCGEQAPTADVKKSIGKNLLITTSVIIVLIILAVTVWPQIVVDSVDKEVNSEYYACIERETSKIGTTKKEYIDYAFGGYRANKDLGVGPDGRPYVSYVGKDGTEYKDGFPYGYYDEKYDDIHAKNEAQLHMYSMCRQYKILP